MLAFIFIESIIEDDAIYLSLEPFTGIVDIDRIAAIYKKFPWIKPYTVSVGIITILPLSSIEAVSSEEFLSDLWQIIYWNTLYYFTFSAFLIHFPSYIHQQKNYQRN